MIFERVVKYKKAIVPISVALLVIVLLTIYNLASNPKSKGSENIAINTSTDEIASSPTPTLTEKEIVKKENVTPTQVIKTTSSTVQSSTGNSQNTPTPTQKPAATTAPTPTPTASPTPTPVPQTGTTIKGRYTDGGGNSLSLPNMKVKISNSEKGISQESTSSPNFEFTNLPPGNYSVEAQTVDGYSIWHNVCFNCDGDDHYYNNANFSMGVSENHTYIGVTFKYVSQ